MNTDTNQLSRLPTQEMTHQIIGCLYSVWNELGYGYQERYYQRAFEKLLVAQQFAYQRELSVPISFQGSSIGRYRLDFLVEDSLIIELKVGQAIHPRFIKQVLAYLASSPHQLALIALFMKDGVVVKRFIDTKKSERVSAESAPIRASAVGTRKNM